MASPSLQIHKAERKQAKLRLALVGPAGSGKTYSALLIAFGLGGKVGMIDTEHGSGELYAGLGPYDVVTLDPPYTIDRYSDAINMFEVAVYDTIIIDSLSHAWAGTGGLLDKKGELDRSKKYPNSFGAWDAITPEHNHLIEVMLNSRCHIIGTMRTKTEWAIEAQERNGRIVQVPRKIGLAPIQRDQLEYEFTVVMELNDQHYASASKDRTSMFKDWNAQITKDTGAMLSRWLSLNNVGGTVLLETAGNAHSSVTPPGRVDESPVSPANDFWHQPGGVEAEGKGARADTGGVPPSVPVEDNRGVAEERTQGVAPLGKGTPNADSRYSLQAGASPAPPTEEKVDAQDVMLMLAKWKTNSLDKDRKTHNLRMAFAREGWELPAHLRDVFKYQREVYLAALERQPGDAPRP